MKKLFILPFLLTILSFNCLSQSTSIIEQAAGGAQQLNDLTDVIIGTPSIGEVLKFNGTYWEPSTDNTGAGGGMNSFILTADGGINQTIEDGELLDIEGGTNITTDVDATNKVVINWAAALNDLSDVSASAPGTNQIIKFNGTAWALASDETGGSMSTWSLTADGGGTETINNLELVDIEGGDNVTTTRSNSTITIDWAGALNDLSNVSASAPSTNQIIKFNGTNWALATDETGTPGMTDWTLLGNSGTGQTILDGESVYIVGSGNISTTAINTDSVEISWSASISDLSNVVFTSPTPTQILTFNGTNWVNDDAPGGYSSLSVDSDNNSPYTLSNSDIIDIQGGDNLTTSHSSSTITINWAANIGDLDNVNSTTPGSGYILAYNDLTSEWVPSPLPPTGMTSFNIGGDEGSPQSVGNIQTANFLGGTNITTTASATRTITIDWEAGLDDLDSVVLGTLNTYDLIYWDGDNWVDGTSQILFSADDSDLGIITPLDFSFKFEGGNGITTDINNSLTPDRVVINLSADLGDLENVSSSSPVDGYVLTWNNGAQEWEPAEVSGGGGGTDDQILSWTLGTATLAIESGNSVNLSGLLDNTDNQTLSWNNGTNQLTITGGNTVTITGFGEMTSFNVLGNTGSGTITNGENFSVIGSNGINFSMSGNVLTGLINANLDNLGDVSASSPSTNQVLKFNGTVWAPATDETGAGGGMTSFVWGGDATTTTITQGESIRVQATSGLDAVLSGNNISISYDWNELSYGGVLSSSDEILFHDVSGFDAEVVTINTLSSFVMSLSDLGDLSNVSSSAPGTNQVLKFNGSVWAPANDETGAGGSSSWDLAGQGSSQVTVSDGDKVDFYGDTGLTATRGGADPNWQVFISYNFPGLTHLNQVVGTEEMVIRQTTGNYNAVTLDCLPQVIPLNGWRTNESVTSNSTSTFFFVVPEYLNGKCIDRVTYTSFNQTGTLPVGIRRNSTNFSTVNTSVSGVSQNTNISLTTGDKIYIQTGNVVGSANGLNASATITCTCTS